MRGAGVVVPHTDVGPPDLIKKQLEVNLILKGRCHEIFNTLYDKKNSTWAPYKQSKTFCKIVSFCEDIREKRISVVIDGVYVPERDIMHFTDSP